MQENSTTRPPNVPYGYCWCGCAMRTRIAPCSSARLGHVKGQPYRFLKGHARKHALDTPIPNPDGRCLCGCGQLTTIAAHTVSRRGWVQGKPQPYIAGHGRTRKRPNFTRPAHILPGYCWCGCGGRPANAPQTNCRYGHIKGEPLPYLKGHRLRLSANGGEHDADPITGCWIWRGRPNLAGYGKITRARKVTPAHVYYFQRFKGPVPDGRVLDHLCRNPRCVNPDHLEPVTQTENTRRGNVAKLNPAKVRVIKQRLAAGEPRSALATDFQVTKACIGAIARGATWKDIDP